MMLILYESESLVYYDPRAGWHFLMLHEVDLSSGNLLCCTKKILRFSHILQVDPA